MRRAPRQDCPDPEWLARLLQHPADIPRILAEAADWVRQDPRRRAARGRELVAAARELARLASAVEAVLGSIAGDPRATTSREGDIT